MSPLRVAVLSLGGTIFMSQDPAGSGAAPGTDGHAAVTGIAVDGVQVDHREVANIGSPSIRPAHLREALDLARAEVDAGAAGVVLSHGTDTLEESAFLLERYWDRPQPLVLTGAMRAANAPGADGPANLRDAVRAAAAPAARALGVLVVMDAQAHGADRVSKLSSRSIGAFGSDPSGPLAVVAERDLHLLHRPLGRAAHLGGDLPRELPAVPVLALGIGDDAALLDAVPSGALAGLVLVGSGMGHVPASAMDRVRSLVAAGTAVVVATRTPRGGTSDRHYSYPGSEMDLIGAGATMAGLLPAHKARLLLQALLADGAGAARIRAVFAEFAV